tara:strand:+ start:1262 stop:3493 length:2232 start_codon:yes stop_codon:yes gene_type:complete
MGLFGLGDFGTGFVEGFANSANEALKADLKKVDLRVEKVAEAKMKRALKQQEERAEELEDIEDALKQGKSLFGDDPRAAQYAASLLKDQGDITAYKSLIAKMKAKKDDFGIDPAGFFARAEIDAPISKGFSISDYAKSYQGADKTLPNYQGIDDKTMTAGAGRLLSSIGLDQDVRGQIDSSVAEQMAASGIVEEAQAERVTLPSIVFNSEDWNLSDKNATEKVTYYTEKLNNPSISEAKRAGYQTKLDTLLNLASKSRDDNVRLSSLEQQYANAPEDKKKDIQTSIITLKRKIKRTEAQGSVDDGTDPLAIKKLNRNDAWSRSRDTNLSEEERNLALKEFYSLGEEINSFTKGEPTSSEILSKLKEKHARKQIDNRDTYKPGNPEFDEAQKEIKFQEGIVQEDPKVKNGLIKDSLSNIDNIITGNTDILDGMPNSGRFTKISRVIDALEGSAKQDAIDDLPETDREIYDVGSAYAKSKAQPIVEDYIDSLGDASEKLAAIAAARFRGYDVSKYESEAKKPDDVATGEAASGAVKDDVTPLPPIEDNEKGARDAIAAQKKGPGGYTIEEIKADIAEAKTQYSPEFVKALEDELKIMEAAIGTDETMVRTAMESGIDYAEAEREQKSAASEDVEAAAKIIERVKGFASKEIRAIEKELGISKAEAKSLYDKVMARKQQAKEDKERNRPRTPVELARELRKAKNMEEWNVAFQKYIETTGRDEESVKRNFPPPKNNKNRGGLMARN